jgi:hypothetical protein
MQDAALGQLLDGRALGEGLRYRDKRLFDLPHVLEGGPLPFGMTVPFSSPLLAGKLRGSVPPR